MSEKIKSRDNGLDLLRIISMMMVVGLHFLGNGQGALSPLGSYNYFLMQFLRSFIVVCVNCFVLISGYYLCTSTFKLKKIVGLWIQVAFYSVGMYVIIAAIQGNLQITEIIKSGLVVTFDRYWFFTAYFLLYLIFPFFNYAIKAMTQRTHLICCLVLVFVFSVLPTFFYVVDFTKIAGGYSFLWLSVLYTVASYIRLYVPKNAIKKRVAVLIYVVSVVIITGENFLADFVFARVFGQGVLKDLFFAYNSIFCFSASLSVFLIFRQINLKAKWIDKTINILAPLSFAVFLIHHHELFKVLLWEFLNPPQFHNSPFLIVYFFICVIGIFLACAGVEFVRQFIFEKCRINKLIGKICDKAESGVLKKLEKIPDVKKE